jgi:hypothetical protein
MGGVDNRRGWRFPGKLGWGSQERSRGWYYVFSTVHDTSQVVVIEVGASAGNNLKVCLPAKEDGWDHPAPAEVCHAGRYSLGSSCKRWLVWAWEAAICVLP